MEDDGAGRLVRAAATGDQSAWEALVDRFGALVWSIARSFRLDGEDAADASQVTWLRLVEHLDRLHEPDRVGAWLATTARHECLRILRQRGRTIPTGDDDDLEPPSAAAVELDQRLLSGERRDALWQALDTISTRCQTLLRVLVADPPPSYEEISAALDMPVGSIGPTRARCLEHLRRAAARTGITGPGGDSEQVRRNDA